MHILFGNSGGKSDKFTLKTARIGAKIWTGRSGTSNSANDTVILPPILCKKFFACAVVLILLVIHISSSHFLHLA